MSISSDKKEIFSTIGAYSSLGKQTKMPDLTNIFPSVNNKDDVIPFLLDTLKVVVGSDALKDLTGEMFTNFIDKIEPKAKNVIKKQITQINANDPIPSGFTTGGTGITIDLPKIDIFKKVKQPTNDVLGELRNDYSRLYNFDNSLINSIKTGDDVNFGDMITIKHNPTPDTITLKTTLPTGSTIGTLLIGLVDSMEIINKKELVSNVMNVIYGTITSALYRTPEETKLELEIDTVIQQLIDDGDDSFVLSPEKLDEISEKALNISKGINQYDMGCGMISTVLSVDDLNTLVTTVNDSTDPFVVANAFNKTIDDAAKNNPTSTDENKQTIRDGFFQKLIKELTTALVKSLVVAPQIRSLLAISSSFQNGGIPNIGEPMDDLKKFKTYIKCCTKEIISMVSEFIFNLILGFLVALLDPIIRKIVKEKINQYTETIKTLIKK